jgi:hypothetical protein
VSTTASTQLLRAESRKHEKYERLLVAAKSLPHLKTAVIHPCDEASLGAAIKAFSLGIIEPILVGPQQKIASGPAHDGRLEPTRPAGAHGWGQRGRALSPQSRLFATRSPGT